MGNACTIHNTTKSSPSPSQVYPPIPEFLQEIYSQYKIDCFSQVKSQSVHSSAIMPLPTINAARSYKKPLYVVNKRNLNKAIQEQASPGPSPSKRMASKSALQFMKLSGNVNPLSKEKWSKESSFVRQNPPSFHTSVSEIYDDGYMEYSRDSESLKVEDLWQDVSRTANSELQKGLSERLAQHNLDDRRRSDSYLTAVQEVFAGKIINVEDYRRGSVEGPLQNNPSPQKRNLKKEEVKMFQFRVEKEESNVKIPTFGKAESPERVKENLEKQPDNSNILNNDAHGIEIQQKMPSQKEKEMRMAKSLTTVAQSFSPIRRSQNASPDDNPFREDKSLYNETISPFEISPMKIDNSNSGAKLPQSGFKPLVKYCSVGALEPAQATGLYDGVQSVSQSKQSNFKGTPVVSDMEKMYASVQLYPTENHVDNTDRSKRDFGPRKSSLMDRLMESLLEDRIRKEEPKAILEAIEKESPSPSVKGNAFEKEKSSYEPSKIEYNSRQRLDYTADQSEISRSIAYKQPTPAQDNNIRFLEKTKNVTTNILKEMDKDINPFKRQENPVEQGNKDSRETHNSLVSSAHVSRGASPHLKSEMLDVSREQILSQMEEARKMMQAKEKRMLLENSFQKERGEIVTDQKAIVEEIKNLQKEVFERMSVVTSNMKGKMLTPKKMLELKDIQDKIQILTQLGTMIEAGEAAAAVKQSQESVSQTTSTRRSISNMKDRNVLPKAESQQKSNRSFNKDARNYFSCSKPSTTTSQTPSQNIKRNSSMTNINANVSTKNTYTSKPASHQSTEPDISLVLKPPSAPSDCKSTQEFLETENECIQNPKEVWKRPISETSNQKPSKNLSYSSEPKSAHKHLMPFPAKELEPYQSVEPRPRRVTEVLSSSKSYLGHDVSIANYSSVMTSSKDLSSQLYPEKKESSCTSTTTTGIHNVIKKLAQPKNLSTYATPQVQQQKPAYRYATVDPTVIPPNPKSVKQQDAGVRRQSTGGERPESKKPSSYKDITLKSRVSSVEKIKPAPVQDKYASLAKNDSQSQLKHNSSNKRLSVGSSSAAVKEYSMSLQDQRDKSPAPKKPVEIEKKQKVDKVIMAAENNENVPEASLNTIMNDSKFENDQAEILYEEITKLDQKLAVTKSTGKIPLVEESMEKSPIKKPRVSESSAERGNKKGSYIQQAVKKSERHFTPLMGRVNRQNHNQSTEIPERRQTIPNLSVQQEQIDSHITTEALGEDAKKGGKYNYNQALQMRIKFAEEVARRQSVADSTEWILNAKLPLYAGKIQDKAKKNQGS